MRNFCYCVGGTGARVAEVAAHLCAMNLVGEQDITFVVVDKDATCGGTDQARKVITSVANLASTDGNTGLKRSTVVDSGAKKQFCKSNLHVENWDFTEALAQVAPQGVDGAASLEQSLSTTKTDAILFDAFYSDAEQQRDTSEGFYGHPSIGAAIFQYMIKNGGWGNKTRSFANDIAYPVKSYLSANPNETAKVFVIGSIFGGTGASIFSNLAAHIRNSAPDNMREKIFISGVLLLPYFTIAAKDGALINPTEFYEKSRVALNQYASDPHLIKNEMHPEGTFDSLYVCGQEPLHTTSEVYDEGGKGQVNHFNFVDLAAAKAMTEFFAANTVDELKTITGGKIYEYRFSSTQDGELTFVNLNNTLGMQKEMVAMLTFCGFILTRVYGQLTLEGNDPANVFMINRLYGNDCVKGLFKKEPTQEYVDKIKPAFDKVANLVYGYCCSYIRFIKDIAKNGYDFSGFGINEHSTKYKFFNPGYIEALEAVCKSFEQENLQAAINGINILLERKDYIPDFNAGITPSDIDDHLLEVFNGKAAEYKRNDVAPELRIGDYIHEAFKFCYSRA